MGGGITFVVIGAILLFLSGLAWHNEDWDGANIFCLIIGLFLFIAGLIVIGDAPREARRAIIDDLYSQGVIVIEQDDDPVNWIVVEVPKQ